MVLASTQGERTVTSEEFFLTYFTTCIEPTELLREVRIPSWPAQRGWAYLKVSRRHGDFALVGVAAHLTLDDSGACSDGAIAMSGVAGTPIRMGQAERELIGSTVEEDTIEQASQLVTESVEPESDVHASADYRRHVSGVLARRALKIALDRAKGGAQRG
jgi:CO/xanthine dehydrogenase FAD-binding subunit